MAPATGAAADGATIAQINSLLNRIEHKIQELLPLQKAALDKIRLATEGINTGLNQAAKGIKTFWASLIVALLALIAGIITALASSATVVGLPAGPFIAAGAAAIAIGAVFAGILNLESEAHGAKSALEKSYSDLSGFHNGHWPPATTG